MKIATANPITALFAIIIIACAVGLTAAALAGTVTLPVTQTWQHKDTAMSCAAGGSAVPHTWDHAVNPGPGCPHCAYYCVPAAVSMYAQYRGATGSLIQQDDIYDTGKSTDGEAPADGILQSHGRGMYDLPPPFGPADEVAAAFTWSVASPHKWGPPAYGLVPMSGSFLNLCIDDNIPVLWCDHHGWPAEIFPEPDPDTADYNGHAKIIAGYNDNGTAVTADDMYLIYDPWPASGSPYWVASAVVLDSRDIYYADYNPVASETQSWGSVKSLFR